MKIELSTPSGSTLMRLSGRFDYTTRNEFMVQADVAVADGAGSEFRIDMSGLDYIDSSALGMLLMLRDKAKKFNRTVILSGAYGYVRQVLDTAQFERLFIVH
jgi:anti-anti-sigma factor